MIPLKDYGYVCLRPGTYEQYEDLQNTFLNYLYEKLDELLGKSAIRNHSLPYFHLALSDNEVNIHDFIASIPNKRKLPKSFNQHPFVQEVIAASSKHTGNELILHEDNVFFRVCRPDNDDSNDLHRDHWFGNYEEVLNIYLPLAGSYVDSALRIVPRSHLWSDEDVTPSMQAGGTNKYMKNGVAYSAPTIGESKHEIVTHRPDVIPGDFMLFNPRIVHGAGDNFSDETRFSLEFRLK